MSLYLKHSQSALLVLGLCSASQALSAQIPNVVRCADEHGLTKATFYKLVGSDDDLHPRLAEFHHNFGTAYLRCWARQETSELDCNGEFTFGGEAGEDKRVSLTVKLDGAKVIAEAAGTYIGEPFQATLECQKIAE